MDDEDEVDRRNGKFVLGWAMPVNYMMLGAYIESYAITKVQISTLRYCVQHAAQSQAISRLSFELIDIIKAMLQEDEMEDSLMEWRRADRCMLNSCRPEVHFSRRRTRSLTGRDPLDPDFVDTALKGHWEDIHDYWYVEQERKICYEWGYESFYDIEEEFAREFGVNFHFNFCRAAESPRRPTHISAYLIIEKDTVHLESDFSPFFISQTTEHVISPEALTPLSEESKQRFRLAANKIGVKAQVSAPVFDVALDWLTDSEDEESDEGSEEEQERSGQSGWCSSATSSTITGEAANRASQEGPDRNLARLGRNALTGPESPKEDLENWPKLMMIGFQEVFVPDRE